MGESNWKVSTAVLGVISLLFLVVLVSVLVVPSFVGHVSKQDYDTINSEKIKLQGMYEELQTRSNKTDKDLDSIEMKYNELKLISAELNETSFDLTYDLITLEDNYSTLVTEFESCVDDYEDLVGQCEFGRVPSQIPTSPSIPDLDFYTTEGGILLKYRDLQLVKFTDTKSMHPVLSSGHTALYTTNIDPYTLQVGNIIVYNSYFSSISVVHRITEVRPDNEEGVCYVLQGDNNDGPDPGCVKPSQVNGIVVGSLFNQKTQGALGCQGDTFAALVNNQVICLDKKVGPIVYTSSMPIESATGYDLCSVSDPSRPYTVIDQNGNVLCYATVN